MFWRSEYVKYKPLEHDQLPGRLVLSGFLLLYFSIRNAVPVLDPQHSIGRKPTNR
jgi:hypothetical protein